MEASQFDRFASTFGRAAPRRAIVRTLVGIAALALGLTGEDAIHLQARKKKGKKKKKKQPSVQSCVTYGNIRITCDPGYACCDPFTSTIGGCSEPGYPVCCASNLFAHIRGSRCCASIFDGLEGFCPPEAPICCSDEQNGGCCPVDYPVCCLYDCCTPDDFCASDGFCFYGYAARRAGAEAAAPKRRVRSDTNARGPRIQDGA